MIAVTKKVAENSVSLLICRNLCDLEEETVRNLAQDVTVYRMNEKGSIVRVSPLVAALMPGQKILIALDLQRLHPDRSAELPHAT